MFQPYSVQISECDIGEGDDIKFRVYLSVCIAKKAQSKGIPNMKILKAKDKSLRRSGVLMRKIPANVHLETRIRDQSSAYYCNLLFFSTGNLSLYL